LTEDPWRFVGGVGGRDLPAVEVFERGEDVIVRAEMAGVDPQDAEVRRTEDTLTIRGERRPEEGRQRRGLFPQ